MDDYYPLISTAMPPYDHQKKAVSETINNLALHGFHALFMEMGTGKTKTVIDSWMVLVATKRADALVIVAPKPILSVWDEEELPKHCTLDYRIYKWDGRVSKKSDVEFDMVFRYQGPAVFLVNVESFQVLPPKMRERMRSFLVERKCFMVVDESSYIKSPDAKRAKNVKLAGQLARYRVIMTGTEITNSPLDLYMQFEFLKPGFWGFKTFFMFKSRYAILEDAYGVGGRTFKKVAGFQRVNELMDRISPYTSRALKRDCLDLPESIYVPIKVEMSDPQKKAYSDLKTQLMTMVDGNLLTVPNKIALFTKFRQITGGMVNVAGESRVVDEKPPKLLALLADLQDTDEQAIIWASFTHEIVMIAESLEEMNLGKTVRFYGEESQDARDDAKRQFQSGAARFIVLNPMCGAFGLNLQNAHLHYFYSRSLRPADNWQAEARTSRPGQRFPSVYKILVCRGTVDERVEHLLELKTDIREQFQTMTIADIVKLV